MRNKRQNTMKVEAVEVANIVQLNVDLPEGTRNGLKMAALSASKPLKHWALEVLTNAAREQLKQKGIPSTFNAGLAC